MKLRAPAFTLILLFLASLRLLAGTGDEYFPLNVGNEWTMDVKWTAPNGRVAEGLFRRRVERGPERDGRKYIRIRTWTVGMPTRTETTRLLRRDEQTIYFLEEGVKAPAEQIEVRLPLTVGDSWEQVAEGQKFTNTVVAIETVEISGKSYEHCFHLRLSSADGSYTEDFWEAPGIGNVKSEIAYVNGTRIALNLREFKSLP